MASLAAFTLSERLSTKLLCCATARYGKAEHMVRGGREGERGGEGEERGGDTRGNQLPMHQVSIVLLVQSAYLAPLRPHLLGCFLTIAEGLLQPKVQFGAEVVWDCREACHMTSHDLTIQTHRSYLSHDA